MGRNAVFGRGIPAYISLGPSSSLSRSICNPPSWCFNQDSSSSPLLLPFAQVGSLFFFLWTNRLLLDWKEEMFLSAFSLHHPLLHHLLVQLLFWIVFSSSVPASQDCLICWKDLNWRQQLFLGNWKKKLWIYLVIPQTRKIRRRPVGVYLLLFLE